MNRLGMMVDITHVSDKTFYDAVAVTKAPVIASHSSVDAVKDHDGTCRTTCCARSRRTAG